MKIAIKGHASRGKEVIQILEKLGGNNLHIMTGSTPDCAYYINSCDNIDGNPLEYVKEIYRVYTLEEFEKEFPFKIGDEVIFPVKVGWASGKVTGLTYVEDQLKYEVYTRIGGYRYVEPHKLSLYPMKEERNITLTLDKAKEWYKKGGELKEIALQAFSEKELNPLPRSWEEFCEKYPIKRGECILEAKDRITVAPCNFAGNRMFKNWIPSKESAESHLAMIQLEQLRNCWRNGWEPIWDRSEKWCIRLWGNELNIGITTNISRFLTFPTKEMAEEFFKCFEELIKRAGNLI